MLHQKRQGVRPRKRALVSADAPSSKGRLADRQPGGAPSRDMCLISGAPATAAAAGKVFDAAKRSCGLWSALAEEGSGRRDGRGGGRARRRWTGFADTSREVRSPADVTTAPIFASNSPTAWCTESTVSNAAILLYQNKWSCGNITHQS